MTTLPSLLLRAVRSIERWIGELRAPDEFEKTGGCSLALRPRAVGAKENVVPDPRDSTFIVQPSTSWPLNLLTAASASGGAIGRNRTARELPMSRSIPTTPPA